MMIESSPAKERLYSSCSKTAPNLMSFYALLEVEVFLSGTLIAAKSIKPSLLVYGTEPDGADDGYRSWISGQRITHQVPNNDLRWTSYDHGPQNFRRHEEAGRRNGNCQRYIDRIGHENHLGVNEDPCRVFLHAPSWMSFGEKDRCRGQESWHLAFWRQRRSGSTSLDRVVSADQAGVSVTRPDFHLQILHRTIVVC